MAELKNTFQFESTLLGPTPEEQDAASDGFINPGAFARQLSDLLKAGLSERGWDIGFVAVEDWGHYISLQENEKQIAFVGCCNIDGRNSFLVFAEPCETEIRRWFRKPIDVSAIATKIGNDIEEILSTDDRCQDLKRDYSKNLPD